MRTGHAKRVLSRYNGHSSSDEVEFDAHGKLTFAEGKCYLQAGKVLECGIHSVRRIKR